ncbi:zinc ABC transporter substrate-binding protein [Gallaecimonas kandeliae]|uniref:metal ABC transporter substrate-binding protein n=1 Tax=Gallaecimonas kandeliae TaxID=3029055 RepID=UPI002647335B|nr:zinc ABC transporter substrate-binding protein [Gallaecimonas kandeliae]WKE65855.1 zinc ABC transporter substrate-binding protein [Gallaecimonas kandeliae]
MKVFKYLALPLLMAAAGAQAKVQIFACEPEWAAVAVEVGGDKVEAFAATTGLQDPHHIQARPSLIAKVRDADMVACTGADLEVGWLPLLLQRASNPDLQKGKPGYFMAANYVRLLGIPKQIDRSQGDVHAAGNPHIQTSPANMLPVARAMAEHLGQLDPANTGYYQQRLGDFEGRWKEAMKKWKAETRPLRHAMVVVHHESWLYLEDWLKLNQVATLEDKPGIPPTSGHLAQILTQMKEQPAKVIIHAAYQSEKPAQWLADKTGIPTVTLPFTIGGTPEAKDLFSLYDDTFKRLLAAVKS